MLSRRMKELLAMLIIGDGIIALLFPRRHCLLWKFGPQPYRDLMQEFAARPGMTRLLGAMEAALGIWLASEQEPR